MKIVAILEADAESGGGFNQALNAILQMREICRGRFAFEVLTTRQRNVEVLRDLDVTAEAFAFSLADRILSLLSPSALWLRLQLRLKLVGPFEKNLLRRGCDLVYFVAPSPQANILQRLGYITTVWDLCHRDTPEFPEVREFAEFQVREHLYRRILPSAFAIITDSSELAAAVTRRYDIDPERLLPMPFSSAPHVSEGLSTPKAAVLAKHGLQEGYFFYPAQFWAHKNHIRILEALVVLKKAGLRPIVAFSGGDMGTLRHVEGFAEQHGLREQVRFLGFVPAHEMRGLYEGCAAVVMPTYFGPTNLPPLEAWMVGKPLVYSTRCAEQAGDAALCADPDDAEDLAQAMRRSLDPAIGADLVTRGRLRLRQIDTERARAEAELLRRLQQFDARRRCWE